MNTINLKRWISKSLKVLSLTILITINWVSSKIANAIDNKNIICNKVSEINWVEKQKCWDFDFFIFKWEIERWWIIKIKDSQTIYFDYKTKKTKSNNIWEFNYNLIYWWCNAIRVIINWKKYISTAEHCIYNNTNSIDLILSNIKEKNKEHSVLKPDNILIKEDEFIQNTWLNIENYPKIKIYWLKNLSQLLWKVIIIKWQKKWKSYLFWWTLVELRINKKKQIYQWALYFTLKDLNKIKKEVDDIRWFSWSPVFARELNEVNWVLSWQYWQFFSISFYPPNFKNTLEKD